MDMIAVALDVDQRTGAERCGDDIRLAANLQTGAGAGEIDAVAAACDGSRVAIAGTAMESFTFSVMSERRSVECYQTLTELSAASEAADAHEVVP
jgi:hypothetical protein